MIRKFVGLTVGVAAIAAAVPASAQYYGYGQNNGYGQNYSRNYGYAQNYGYGNYGQQYAYGANTNLASQQCSAAVQNRLYNRSSIGGILGAVLGTNTSGRVVSITQAEPRNNGTVRVRGLASSGRYASNGYGPYGVGAYGAAGYGYANAADLSFRCDVGMNGQVYNVSINRR
jgi:hypothetical protein